jgi:surfactin synthase thioesterase subunit
MCWRKLNADWTEKPIRILFFEFFGGNAKLFQFVVQELPGNAEVTGS